MTEKYSALACRPNWVRTRKFAGSISGRTLRWSRGPYKYIQLSPAEFEGGAEADPEAGTGPNSQRAGAEQAGVGPRLDGQPHRGGKIYSYATGRLRVAVLLFRSRQRTFRLRDAAAEPEKK